MELSVVFAQLKIYYVFLFIFFTVYNNVINL